MIRVDGNCNFNSPYYFFMFFFLFFMHVGLLDIWAHILGIAHNPINHIAIGFHGDSLNCNPFILDEYIKYSF